MHPKLKRVILPKVKVWLVATLLVATVLLVWKAAVTYTRFTTTGLSPLNLLRLAFNTGAYLPSWQGRTNLLLLGIPGGTHPGADLTDTMMVLSLNPDKRTVAIISLPRDIWSDTLKDKINSAYHYGEEKKQGGGMVMARVVVEDVIGVPIHFALVIDFSGFEKLIDAVDGITVAVKHGFVDDQFPISGKEEDVCDGDPQFRCRFEVLRFAKGVQYMDGEQALKYVRSRQAEGEEGSDFARSRRQQEVLVALKRKLTDPRLWFSPRRASAIMAAVNEAIEADMTLGELLTVGKLLVRVEEGKIEQISIEELLYPPPLTWYGRYVLLPTESFSAIHDFIKDKLKE